MSTASEPLAPVNGAHRRGLVLMLVVFVLGLVCGAALSVIAIRSVLPARPSSFPRHAGPLGAGDPGFEGMAEHLGLSEEQRRQVRQELDSTRLEVHRLLDESGERIRALLDEDQRRRFDEMRRRHHVAPRLRGPGPPPAEPEEEGPPPAP